MRTLSRELNALVQARDVLMFRKVRDDDFDIGRLFAGSTSTPAENAAYHSTVGDDFDAWRSRTIRKKFSKELGRLQRQMEREFGSYEHRAGSDRGRDPRSLRLPARLAQRTLRGRPAAERRSISSSIATTRSRPPNAARLITYVSYVAGEPVAVLFGLVGDGEFHAVLIGSDTQRFGRSSPGTQIIYQIIKRRFEEGFRQLRHGSRQ